MKVAFAAVLFAVIAAGSVSDQQAPTLYKRLGGNGHW